MDKYILALDSGTTSSRSIIFDKKGKIASMSQKEFKQIFPFSGWVEHNPEEIWETQLFVAKEAIKKAGLAPENIAAIGIANQRETTIVWDRNTGKPVYNAIVWQCRRTAKDCDILKSKGLSEVFRKKTGLIIDAYFSATKLSWILKNIDGARKRAEKGELLFGTVETWLIWKLTGGKVHITDYSNASRTMMFNINTLRWDEDILSELGIPFCMLPEVKPSSFLYGNTAPSVFGRGIPVSGAVGDQQSALFAQGCFEVGDIKNTYGTGCFMLMNTGRKPVFSKNGLVTTIAWGIDGEISYALEGSVFVAGAVIQWLRDELNILSSSKESEDMVKKVSDTNGCYIVPAFTGIGAPYWDQYARGVITGLTRGVNKNHIVRAALESIAYQTKDVMSAMEADLGMSFKKLKADGGASENNFLMQFQADIINAYVERPECVETTAAGAAYFAGLAVSYWESREEILKNIGQGKVFSPNIDEEYRKKLINGWKKAVMCSFGWAKEE